MGSHIEKFRRGETHPSIPIKTMLYPEYIAETIPAE